MLGKLLDNRYRLVEKIGEGGMGSIYKAIHTEMGRTCAIKLLTAISTANEEAIARFKREAKMASRIDNPHAVTIYDFGEAEGGELFLAMEYIDGKPLSRLIAQERVLPIDRVIHITSQVAEGLAAAHAMEIVHRDLKPDNIMITRKGADVDYVKVLDFGIAKTMTEDAADNLTKTGFVLGTPFYMSPEQLLGEKLDPRSDIYSLAIIVYEMLCGKLPFVGDNPQAVMMKRITGEPVPLRAVAPALSESIEQVVMSGLARDREARIQTVLSFASALRSAAHGGTQFIGMRSTKNLGGEGGERATMEWASFTTDRATGPGVSADQPHTMPINPASTVEAGPGSWPATQAGKATQPQTPNQQAQDSLRSAPQQTRPQQQTPQQQQAPQQPHQQPSTRVEQSAPRPVLTRQGEAAAVEATSVTSEPERRSRGWMWAAAAAVVVAAALIGYALMPRGAAAGPTLVIRGVPPGSQLFVNDQRRDAAQSDGTVRLTGLDEGQLAIRISREGYADFSTTVSARKGEEKSIEAALLPTGIEYSGEMVLIPAGEFVMGDDSHTDFEKPSHKVSLPAYYIDKYEVTNEQYQKFCRDTATRPPENPEWRGDYFTGKPDSPVIGVTWDEAKKYAGWAGKRLPSEEEWEKAASWDPTAQQKRIWPWGNMNDPSRANLGTRTAASVKQYAGDLSAYGVYGMAGNAMEWVENLWGPYEGGPAQSPNFGKGYHVVKGGSFIVELDKARTAYRDWLPLTFPPNMTTPVGFRCAISADDPRIQQRLRQPGK
jgi:serine/threonine protein kinase/formylglycine-generating enzyme required for sulfatase activity